MYFNQQRTHTSAHCYGLWRYAYEYRRKNTFEHTWIKVGCYKCNEKIVIGLAPFITLGLLANKRIILVHNLYCPIAAASLTRRVVFTGTWSTVTAAHHRQNWWQFVIFTLYKKKTRRNYLCLCWINLHSVCVSKKQGRQHFAVCENMSNIPMPYLRIDCYFSCTYSVHV